MKNKKLFEKEYSQALGLTKKEMEFYLSLLKLGNSSVQAVAKEMSIFRSSAYVLMEALLKKGVISQTFKKRGRVLIPEPPNVLRKMIKEQEDSLKKAKHAIEEEIPELLSMYEKSLRNPTIKVYEGAKGLKAIHEDILETGRTLYCYPRLDIAMDILPFDFQIDFVKRRVKKGIKVKGLLVKSPEMEEVIVGSKKVLDGKNSLREARILPTHLHEEVTAEKMFYGAKMVYMTYGKKVTGLVIEHEEVVELEKRHFNILWRISTEYKGSF